MYKVKAKWLNSSKGTTTKEFDTVEEVYAFILGIRLCFEELGDGDYEISMYKNGILTSIIP